MNSNKIKWNREGGRWSGICPRCGHRTYFESKSTIDSNGGKAETIFCPGGHGLYVEYEVHPSGSKQPVKTVCPVDYKKEVPDWLPEPYQDAYKELLEVKDLGLNRSVVSICSILLEAHVNEMIKNPGEKKKTLFERLAILFKQDVIDKDQFSSATITRLTRNNVLHPDDILKKPEENDANIVFEEVTNFLERIYKFRTSRALPEGEKKNEGKDSK